MSEKVIRLAPNVVDLKLGREIRAQRKLKKIELVALADILGLSEKAYSQKEAGFKRFNGSELMTLCHCLDTTPASLMSGVQEVYLSEGQGKSDTDPLEYLGELMKILPQEELRAIAYFCRLVYD